MNIDFLCHKYFSAIICFGENLFYTVAICVIENRTYNMNVFLEKRQVFYSNKKLEKVLVSKNLYLPESSKLYLQSIKGLCKSLSTFSSKFLFLVTLRANSQITSNYTN